MTMLSLGLPFSNDGDVVISQDILGSLIWLLMLLEHPRGFRSEPTLMEWLVSNLAIRGHVGRRKRVITGAVSNGNNGLLLRNTRAFDLLVDATAEFYPWVHQAGIDGEVAGQSGWSVAMSADEACYHWCCF
jgi:hypothetical protein